jgi:bifunctional NMN adenylyltransferase/nudix hydrolase
MFTEKYKSQYASLPYPPTFVTVDAVVYDDHYDQVLMIRRKDEPGKGLWALPGGFLDANADRCLEDAVLRELNEETNLNISNDDIYSSWVFDSIERSSRGRTITHAFFCDLSEENLPEVIPGDDAAIAQWISLTDLNPSECFEDHYEIINHFLEIRDITNYFEDL